MKNNKTHLRNLLQRKGIREYNQAVGGLGLPSKMPGYSYGISREHCKTGGKLAQCQGTICARCYASGGNYQYPSVKTAHEKRWEAMQNLSAWCGNMARLLEALTPHLSSAERYFRFHDSGDLQGIEHLRWIVLVAIRNPEWRFWLPTKERGILRRFKEQHDIPSNLTIRVSSNRVGQGTPRCHEQTSTVGWNGESFQCPAGKQKNECGICRACWNRGVSNVNYKLQ